MRSAGVLTLVTINVVLYLLDHVVRIDAVKALYLNHQDWRVYQLLTSAFCHANWAHLSGNVFLLYVFGRLVEEEKGPLGVALVYGLTAVGASILSLVLNRGHIASLGASGAVFGLFVVATAVGLLEIVILGQFVVMQCGMSCRRPASTARLGPLSRSGEAGNLDGMSVVSKKSTPEHPATVADLLAMPEDDRYELVDGELVPKEGAKGKHGGAQARTCEFIGPYNRRSGGPPERPGGWRFASEVLVQFTPTKIRRPDIAGWRRERLPAWPDTAPITVIPDWICEVLSSNRAADLVVKMSLYQQSQVKHYWILDPEAETLTVLRWTAEGYLHVLGAQRGDRVRAEPFEAVELSVGVFFGEDED